MKRIVFDIILFAVIFLLPWWVATLMAFLGIFIFKQYYEFIGVFIVLYGLYTVMNTHILTSPIWFSIIVSLIYIGIQYSRRFIILYKNEI